MRGNKLFKFVDKYVGIPLLFALGKICAHSDKRKPSPAITHPDNILLIKLSAMGDTILMIPAVRSLKKKYPEAKIKMIVTGINKDVMNDCPYLDELIFLDVDKLLKNPLSFFTFIKSLRKISFDLVIDFDQWLRLSPLISFFSGAAKRIGFKTPGQYRDFIYTEKTEHARNRHEVECFLDLLRAIGIETDDKKLELWIKKEVEDDVYDFLSINNIGRNDTLIGVHPGCGGHGGPREWPWEKYVELVKLLQKTNNIKIIFTGTGGEKELIEKISNKPGSKPMIVIGWKLAKVAALIKRMNVLVCGNTGVMHMACAVRTPVVALHGPTNPLKWGPWGENHTVIKANIFCSPCLYLGFEYGCRDYPCMGTIEVDNVYNKVKEYLR